MSMKVSLFNAETPKPRLLHAELQVPDSSRAGVLPSSEAEVVHSLQPV